MFDVHRQIAPHSAHSREGTRSRKRTSRTEGPLRATTQAEPRQCTAIVQVQMPMVAIGKTNGRSLNIHRSDRAGGPVREGPVGSVCDSIPPICMTETVIKWDPTRQVRAPPVTRQTGALRSLGSRQRRTRRRWRLRRRGFDSGRHINPRIIGLPTTTFRGLQGFANSRRKSELTGANGLRNFLGGSRE